MKFLLLIPFLFFLSCSTCKPTKITVYKRIKITCIVPNRPTMPKISDKKDFYDQALRVRENILKFKKYILELEGYMECVKKQSN